MFMCGCAEMCISLYMLYAGGEWIVLGCVFMAFAFVAFFAASMWDT